MASHVQENNYKAQKQVEVNNEYWLWVFEELPVMSYDSTIVEQLNCVVEEWMVDGRL